MPQKNKRSTLNAQRSTLNDRPQRGSTWRSGYLNLLRCGTSPLGNHGEVQAAESRKDFVHKLRICLKELKETRRWLRLLQHAGLVSKPKMQAILGETEELVRIFSASIRTAEKNTK